MSEEEIIEKANELLTRVMSGYGLAKVDKIHLVLEGLLDLYNKEKEKNKLLIEEKFREVADKNSYIKDNYVSKDKIRELLKDVNETLEYAKNNDLLDVIFFMNGIKNSLEELLEE